MTQLISGTSSGFGKYCHEQLGGDTWKRDGTHSIKEYDYIIHCGWGGNTYNPTEYLEKALIYYNFLSYNKCKKFIFISTIDIYPKNNRLHKESDNIDAKDILGISGLAKLAVEQEIQNHRQNYLILRCGALLGKYTPDNNLRKLATSRPLSIKYNSIFNLVLYENILDFIKLAIEKDLTGIYNIVANNNIKLYNLGYILPNKSTYRYVTPHISCDKLYLVDSSLVTNSYDNWEKWKQSEYYSDFQI